MFVTTIGAGSGSAECAPFFTLRAFAFNCWVASVKVEAAGYHSQVFACGLNVSDEIECWGQNNFDQAPPMAVLERIRGYSGPVSKEVTPSGRTSQVALDPT